MSDLLEAPSPVDEQRQARGRHLVRASVLVSAMATAWKVIGLVREMASAAIFGATRSMDAFVVARTAPDMFSTWIEMPVRSAIVPLFTRRRHEQGEAEAWRAASNVLNTLALAIVPLAAALVLGADVLVRMLSTGFRDETTWDESALLSRIIGASVLFSVPAVILGSLSNIYGRQFVPALGRVLNGVLVLAGVLWLGPRLGVEGYAWGMLAGAAAYFFVQLDVVWRHRAHYRLTCRPFAPEVRELLALALPLFIGLTGTRIDVLLDRNFASFLPEGSLAILAYATMLSAVVTDLMMVVATSVFLPHFSDLFMQKRFAELRDRIVQSLGGYLLLTLPVAAILCAAARPIVDLLFGRGRFTPEDVAITSVVLVVLAVADPAFGAGQIMAQAHISRGDTKTPMKVGFVRIGFKAVLSVSLLPWLGIYGLAAATAASSFLRTFLLWRRLPDEIRPPGARVAALVGRLLVPALAAGLALFGLLAIVPAFGDGALAAGLRLGTLALAALAVYAGGATVFGGEFVRPVLRRVLGRVKR